MELKYSPSGVPYLELDTDNKLIFSKTSAIPKGYKWLVFSGLSTMTETISAGKGKKKTKKKVVISAPMSTSINMEFTKISRTAKNTNPYLTKSYMNGLKKLFAPYLEDGVFPYTNLPKFEKDINNLDVINKEDLLEEDPAGYYEDDDEDEEIM